jgi:cation diffusion facilitator CzcD-associated flavoprotein CzcO
MGSHSSSVIEDLDVLIVGAGISGIGAACHQQHACPGKRFMVPDSQPGVGGTWRTHRYPGIRLAIDGQPLRFGQSVGYRGAMFTGVPNMAWVFGGFRASWTLRADLLADFVCRLLKHMDATGAVVATPALCAAGQGMALKPWVDADSFNPGDLACGLDPLPRQGTHAPWLHRQDHAVDKDELPRADLDDGALVYR